MAAKGAAAVREVSHPWPSGTSPGHYIVKVSRETGEEIPGPIEPDELLVHAHRDKHPVEIAAQFAASRFIRLTGNERIAREGVRAVNRIGGALAEGLGWLAGSRDLGQRAKRLLGVRERDFVFRFRETTHLSDKEARAAVEKLQREARAALRRVEPDGLRLLITGATGFLGKEVLAQAAADPRIAEVVAVVRPETIRDPKTKEVLGTLSPKQRGRLLLRRLHIDEKCLRKFRFVGGDIEKKDLGLPGKKLEKLRRRLTHVIHCAASVSFDDAYENSYRANVLGNRNALLFSLSCQREPGSPFVAHVAIETSYIHGRKKRSIAQESALVFPRHFYNNFYELTKAMASIETDRAMVERGLRVTQLLPSIVIGHSLTGNNRGDTKVLNAPVNAFGRSKEAVEALAIEPLGQARARLIALLATSFPGDRSAEINLVPVDRVAAGILAALHVPEAIGARIHLATDDRLRCDEIARIAREELGVRVRLADPTLYRTLFLPVVKAVLAQLEQPKLASALEKLGTIFGVYGEWGQPIHDVGNDVRILGLPIRRPDSANAFRMLCRHNKYVQEFARLRDPDEIARRERVWEQALAAISHRTGREAAAIESQEFRRLLAQQIDLRAFEPVTAPKRSGKMAAVKEKERK
jgi:nucleoside-diphosphate-sugar epimerase